MFTDQDVYCAYRRANSLINNKPYRLPKDWNTYREKMNVANRKWLETCAMYFNTTYSNVDMDEYMKCGFEVFKDFTYKHLLNTKVLNHYIHKDKVKKRRMDAELSEIKDSFHFIREYLADKPRRQGYTQLQNFCKFRDGEVKTVINMYVKGKIDTMTIMYCIFKKYLILSDDDRAMVPYVSQRYRELLDNLQSVKREIAKEEQLLEV